MPTSNFFNNYVASNEQQLLDSLVVESVKIHGIDMYYVPRTLNNFDQLNLTDDQSSYENSYMIECYLKNVLGFGGDKTFMSKFAGLEIRDQVIFEIPRTTFQNEVGIYTGLTRPREGDLLYFPFPLLERVFQIKFVDPYNNMFFQMGTLQTWEVTCELFEYSNETFNTGIEGLDRIQKQESTNIIDYALLDTDGVPLVNEDGDYIVTEKYDLVKLEPDSDNKEVAVKADPITDWTALDPFSEGPYEKRI